MRGYYYNKFCVPTDVPVPVPAGGRSRRGERLLVPRAAAVPPAAVAATAAGAAGAALAARATLAACTARPAPEGHA